MFTRLFLSLLLTAAGGKIALAAGINGDPDRPVITGKLYSADKTGRPRRAMQSDVNRLKKLKPRPSIKCARIEYIHQCLTSRPMTLRRVSCRPGQTEAACCENARTYVTTRVCGPLRDRLKKAGKPYSPGIFVCKCTQQAPDPGIEPSEWNEFLRR